MSDISPLNIPKPPAATDYKDLTGSIKDIHKHLQDLYLFHQTHFSTGTQATFFSQSQLNQMTQQSQAGKIFMNNDTGKINVGEIVGGSLMIKEVVTT